MAAEASQVLIEDSPAPTPGASPRLPSSPSRAAEGASKAGPAATVNSAATAAAAAAAAAPGEAVSYTHLTLPTICSV
eukprot:7230523-Alexandrium_andersonii.AAC.1